MKKNIVIVILLLLVIGLAGYLGYDKFLKDEPIKTTEGNSTEETLPVEENDEKYSKSLIGKYIGQKKLNTDANVDLNIQVDILNDTEMTLSADDTQSETETTKGTYTVEGNILTYTRVYVKNENNEWVRCNDTENSSVIDCGAYKLLKTESFIIDKDNSALYSTNYGTNESFAGYGPITLK